MIDGLSQVRGDVEGRPAAFDFGGFLTVVVFALPSRCTSSSTP